MSTIESIATRTRRFTTAAYPSPMRLMNAVMRSMIPVGCPGLRNSEQSAGDSVSALIAEMTIAAEIVTANCRKSTPLDPGRKAIGTNTDNSTSVMATTGPAISAMALRVASCGESSGLSSITRSTFSTTMIASSTTMPMASTSASREMVFAE